MPTTGLFFKSPSHLSQSVSWGLSNSLVTLAKYAGGTIMDPDNGKTYKCKMWVKGDVLTSRGYIGFLYRTQQWFRVK